MKLLAALVALSFKIALGRRLQTDSVPTFTAEECDAWLAGASAFDTDASGGLSLDKYFKVLLSLGLTTVATSYAELAFNDKMAFASLACSCVSLGLGEDCCLGADAKIPLSVLSTSGDPAVDAYKTDLCNLLAYVIKEETASPVAAPAVGTEAPVAGTTPPTVAVVITEPPVAVEVTESPVAVGATEPPVAGTTPPTVAVVITEPPVAVEVTESPVAVGVTEPLVVASAPIIFDVPGVVSGYVVGRLDMYRTKVLLYRTMVLMARLTKVRR